MLAMIKTKWHSKKPPMYDGYYWVCWRDAEGKLEDPEIEWIDPKLAGWSGNAGQYVWSTPVPPQRRDGNRHKLDEEKVLRMRELEGTASATVVGEMFGVGRAAVSSIWARRTWGDI